MSILQTLKRFLPGHTARTLRRQLATEQSRFVAYASSITAANGGANGTYGGRGRGSWMGMPADEDAANKEYAFDRIAIMQRAQDLHVNNPDVGGFNIMRVGQISGPGVHFKHAARAGELELTDDQLDAISEQIDRLRQLHSENGGFDAQKGCRWEGKQQERALLTMLVYGACLIHRVASNDPRSVLPFSIELIPGSRISTPHDKLGDPLVSFGVRYADNHRTKVAGYYVRRVSMTIGNSFVPDYDWDFLPEADCSLLELTEPGGIDQALPLCARTMRMLRNRGEFIEAAVEAARAQSGYLAITQVAPGVNPWDMAQDDRQAKAAFRSIGPVNVGGGVSVLYDLNGQKTTMNTAHLPEPDFAAFWDITDQRIARGNGASVSAFTRKVLNSFAGGRLERQQDDPILDQYRLALRAAWHRLNGWLLESIWLAGLVDLPGYSERTRHLWNQFRAEFPETPDINPQDTATANETNLMLGKTSPQRLIEKSGADPAMVLDERGRWLLATTKKEQELKLPDGSLSILYRGRALTSMAGDDIGAPTPTPEPQPGADADSGIVKKKKSNRGRRLNGYSGVFR